MDVAPGQEVFRRQRRVFRDGVRGGGAGLSARDRRRLQGPEAGEPIARPSRIRETGQTITIIIDDVLLGVLLALPLSPSPNVKIS